MSYDDKFLSLTPSIHDCWSLWHSLSAAAQTETENKLHHAFIHSDDTTVNSTYSNYAKNQTEISSARTSSVILVRKWIISKVSTQMSCEVSIIYYGLSKY